MPTRTQAIKQATALPEKQVGTPDFITAAKAALEARSRKAQAEVDEKAARVTLEALSEALRVQLVKEDEYVGILRIVDPTPNSTMPPVRIEFRIQNGSLSVDENETLAELFGPMKPQLFEKASIVTEIHDPALLFDALKTAGHDPWAILNVSVKEGMDSLVAKLPGVTAAEAILPKKGLLARLAEFGADLMDEAKTYIKQYLVDTLKPTVVIGTKGKA